MKKVLFILSILTFNFSLLTSMAQKPAIPRDAALEAKVEKTLAKMTLDEKIGQMLELNLDVMGNMKVENAKVDREKVRSVMQQYGTPKAEADAVLKMTDAQIIERFGSYPVDIYQGDTKRVWQLNEVMLDTLISKWKVGSILNAPGTRAPSVEQWQKWITLIQEKSMKYLGIPDIYGLDHNHGVTYTQGGTLFPQPINLGASFNTDLAFRGAEITAYESRAANCPWVYNPVVDLSRDPRWPRVYESFGEDAILNSKMVVAEIKGYQGEDNNHIDRFHVGTSTKHYFAYGAPWTGKDRTPAYLNPQMIREKYFEPFKAAALAGTLTMMVNSASVNGVPVHASYEYLTKWLKEDLQWDGFLVTDWADINNLFTREKVAKDKKDAIRIAINAGIDMSMDPYSVEFCILLKELVNEGKVKMSRIDDAVRRILRAKYRLGLFDEPNTGGKGFEKFGSDEFAAASLKAAEESIVLLKNEDGILPLKGNHNSQFSTLNSQLAAFGGPDAAHPSFTPTQKAISYSMTSFFTTGGIRGGKKKLDKFYPRSFNMGIRRDVYMQLGGFTKMRFGEDIDFSYRICEAGYTPQLIPEAWVWHKRRTDFRKFFRQVYNSGIARINLEKRHPGTMKLVHLLPAAFTIGVTVLVLIAAFGRIMMVYGNAEDFRSWYYLVVAALAPLLLYSLLIFADSSLKNRSMKVGALSVPAAFIQLMGYGTGFLVSWWKRCVLGKDEFHAFEKNFYK